ncbi:MAG: hypothetical protein Q9191_005451 [Dirinaria sp. TL-2023a]
MKEMSPLEIIGHARDRFIQAAVLLYTLNSVRGEPSGYDLDQDPHNIEISRERLLKRKFLDSFALICATKKDGDSVSTACLEERSSQETVVRIASNSGVRENTLVQLRELVNVLNDVASGVLNVQKAYIEILIRIVRLDTVKIRHYLKDLCITKCIFEQFISAVQSRVMQSFTTTMHADSSALRKFLEWYEYVFLIKNLAFDPDLKILVRHIQWAQDAKRYYVEFLKAAFSTTAQTLLRWIYTIFKLGRYGIAFKALAQFASEVPSLFNPLIVEIVTASAKTRFAVQKDKIPLTCVLRRVVGGHEEEYLSRLARIWNTEDSETYFQKACSLNLTVHAEMQLVSFYDYNHEHKPPFRFLAGKT